MTVSINKKGIKKLPASISPASVTRLVSLVFRNENVRTRRDVNIVFVDNKTIRRLNRLFLNERGLTDVIAFPYEDGKEKGGDSPFGDIYISVPVAQDNASRFQVPYEEELARLVIHGLLHLLGYDDHAPKKRKAMWDKQEVLVRKWGGG